ncbi:MAG: SHOCT domain-containing protein [Caldilineaceae bacterium]|nr:SHOCT domain-containing protein [Caldilineaceae bacterium]
MMGGWMDGMGWGWLLIFLALLAVVIGVTLVVRSGWLYGSRARQNMEQPPRTPNRAMENLKERYARGEITRVEYEEMRRELEE